MGNKIYGNSGDNTSTVGLAPMLTGGAGNDTFVFHMGEGNGDIVVDLALMVRYIVLRGATCNNCRNSSFQNFAMPVVPWPRMSSLAGMR